MTSDDIVDKGGTTDPQKLGPDFVQAVDAKKAEIEGEKAKKRPRAKASGAKVNGGDEAVAPVSKTARGNGKGKKSAAKIAEELKAEAAPVPEVMNRQPPPIDPFDDDSVFDVDQNFIETVGVEPATIDVPVCKKPEPDDWVKVNADPSYKKTVALLDYKRRLYLLTNAVAAQLARDEYIFASLYLAVTRENEPFIWYVKEDKTAAHNWFSSSEECVAAAMEGFIRVRTGTKGYKCERIKVLLPAPKWPKENFKKLRKIAFQKWFIDSIDHDVIKLLRGLK